MANISKLTLKDYSEFVSKTLEFANNLHAIKWRYKYRNYGKFIDSQLESINMIVDDIVIFIQDERSCELNLSYISTFIYADEQKFIDKFKRDLKTFRRKNTWEDLENLLFGLQLIVNKVSYVIR